MQAYDPARLVREVRMHLQLQGLSAELAPGRSAEAQVAAAQLLRAFGLTPAVDGVDALVRAVERPWG